MRRKTISLVVGLILVLAGSNVIHGGALDSVECANYEDYFHWESCTNLPGQTYGVAVTETHAYVAVRGEGLHILDLADPGIPVPVGSLEIEEFCYVVTVSGDIAVLKSSEVGIDTYVINVSDPTNPFLLASMALDGGRLESVPGYFYVTSTEGLVVVDVTDPTDPEIIEVVPVSDGVDELVIRGDLLYVSGNSGLTVMDISDPALPAVIASAPYGSNLSRTNLAVDDQYACVGGYNNLYLFDIGNAEAPALVEQYPMETRDVELRGDLIYVITDETHAVSIIDISDPSDPVVRMNMEDHYLMGRLTLGGSHLYVTADVLGVYSFDLGDAPIVDPLATVETPGRARGVVVAGGYAYVADWADGVQIVDLEAATGPEIVASIPIDGRTWSLLVSDDVLYIGDLDDGLRVADIQDPGNPVLIGFYPLDSGADAVAPAGDLLSVGSGTELYLFDVDVPASPVVIGSWDAAHAVRDLVVRGNLVYMTGTGNLSIADITDPETPLHLATLELPTTSYGLAVRETIAYIATWWAGLVMVDVADPANPLIIGIQDTANYARNVALMGHYAYVADSGAGVQIIDVADPANPFLVGRAGFMENPGAMLEHHLSMTNMVTISSNRMYMTCDDNLQILPLQCGEEGEVVDVVIDLKPGSDTDPVNCEAKGVIPVAILSTAEFDALDVDHETVVFGPGEAREAHSNIHGVKRHEVDVDYDGDLDLMFHFRTQETGLTCTEEEIVLRGWTFDGREIRGVTNFAPTPPLRNRLDRERKIKAWPNPFNPSITIQFELPAVERVDLQVFDVSGRLVRSLLRDKALGAGIQNVKWDGRDDGGQRASAGVYFYRLSFSTFEETRRIVMIK